MNLPHASSITHQHLLAVLNTEISRRPEKPRSFSILDAGCGAGLLTAYVYDCLRQLYPEMTVEVHGLDVNDYGLQVDAEFLSKAVKSLMQKFPECDWKQRIVNIYMRDPWPFPDAHFDAVISNQVLEHVYDHELFFGELRRTLKEGAFSAHLFPVRSYTFEGHILVPFGHRPINHDLARSWIRLANRMGFGRFKTDNDPGDTLDEFAEKEADRLLYSMNYLTMGDLLKLGKRQGLRVSFRYTNEFYTAKLRQILRMAPRYSYKTNRSYFFDWLSVQFLKYASSLMLFIQKKNTVPPSVSSSH